MKVKRERANETNDPENQSQCVKIMRITFSSYSTPSLLSFFNHFYLCLSLPQQSSLKAIRYGLAGKYFLLNGKESWLHKAGFSAVGYEEGLHTGERGVRKGSPSRRGGHCNI